VLPFTGRPVGVKRTQQGSRPRGFSSEIASRCDADAFLPAEGSIRQRPGIGDAQILKNYRTQPTSVVQAASFGLGT